MLRAVATAAVMLTLAADVRADEVIGAASGPSDSGPSLGSFEAQFAASVRHAQQNTDALNVPSNGVGGTPVRLLGSYFFWQTGIGIAARFDYEHYGLYSPAGTVGPDGKPVSLAMTGLQASLAVAGRVALPGGLSLQGRLGYAYEMVPVVGVDAASQAATAASIQYSSPLIAALVSWDPSRALSASASAQWLPISIGSTSPNGSVSASALALGAEVAFGGMALGGLRASLLLTYEYDWFRATSTQLSFLERDHRLGIGIRATLGPAEHVVPGPPTGPGTIRGTVAFDDAPSPAAGIDVEVGGGESVKTDANGAFVVPRAGPGSVTLRARAPQYLPAEVTLTVPPEAAVTATLKLHRPSGPGRVRGVVFEAVAGAPEGRQPLAGATVTVRGGEVVSAADGSFQIESVGPGPVSLQIAAKDHKPANEVVAVPPEAEATLTVVLQKVGARKLATIKGHVRSVSGAPVRANLQIPEANARVAADVGGSFSVRLPGGRYTVKIEAAGFVSQLRTIDVADGDQAIFNVDLKPAAQ